MKIQQTLISAKYGFFLLVLSVLVSCKQNTNETSNEMNENLKSEENSGKKDKRIQLRRNDEDKRVDIFIEGEHFTSYIYPENLEKPVLYPLRTAEGTPVTRGFPLESREGERVDHPHHVGLWFNYGDVNGLDFWNNSSAISEEKKEEYGSIIHKKIESISSGNEEGILVVNMEWVNHKGEALLEEHTTFVFSGENKKRIIDRTTTLTALDKDVSMKDNKEGMLGMRVARELEHPTDKAEIFTDASGEPTEVASMNNEGVTGRYRSSQGIKGDEVWGTRGKWMNLSGEINGEKISVAILDHPENVGYPTYWHARGYGLYAANPLGQKAMSGGKEELNFELPAGASVRFKHRIIISSGETSDEQLNQDFKKFAD
jgi:hypothetical protein